MTNTDHRACGWMFGLTTRDRVRLAGRNLIGVMASAPVVDRG